MIIHRSIALNFENTIAKRKGIIYFENVLIFKNNKY